MMKRALALAVVLVLGGGSWASASGPCGTEISFVGAGQPLVWEARAGIMLPIFGITSVVPRLGIGIVEGYSAVGGSVGGYASLGGSGAIFPFAEYRFLAGRNILYEEASFRLPLMSDPSMAIYLGANTNAIVGDRVNYSRSYGLSFGGIFANNTPSPCCNYTQQFQIRGEVGLAAMRIPCTRPCSYAPTFHIQVEIAFRTF